MPVLWITHMSAIFSTTQIVSYFLLEQTQFEFVDLRFTDIKGAWHHLTYRYSAVNRENLENGFPFDGSSIDAWQPINKSDMILKPSVETAFLDPFTADSTAIVICNVYDIYKNEMYAKCPRSIAAKSLEYLTQANVGDVAYFGPENEFFIFEDVKVKDSAKKGSYIQRYKGLGEMNPEELWQTTLNPEKRTLLQVKYSNNTKAKSKKDQDLIQILMGDDVAPRKNFIISRALEVSNLDI